ncbi:MAG TPA: hypothetical protein VLX61_00320 [Anaerolineales bacterium]|nr:hypothetical protein [Anaerolineales bacterium]
MTVDEAIQAMKSKISAACPAAETKAVKISDEEARLTVLAPAGDMQQIKDATFQSAIDFLNQDGLDIQVFVYDKDAPPLKG